MVLILLFVPLFFANIGLKIDFFANFHFPLVLLVCVVGIAGRYLGAWVGVTTVSITSWTVPGASQGSGV